MTTKFISLITVLATLIGIYQFFSEEITSYLSQNSNELQITEVNLRPSQAFFDSRMPSFVETATISFKIRNFGGEEIILTSAKAKIINSQSLKFATYGQGKGILGSKPEINESIKIKPGETEIITLSKGVKLTGITEFLDNSELKKGYISDFGNGYYLLHDSSWVKKLNDYFSIRYGRDAAISITLYKNYNKQIKEQVVNFTTGSDIFDKSGQFQYDLFLGTALKLNQK